MSRQRAALLAARQLLQRYPGGCCAPSSVTGLSSCLHSPGSLHAELSPAALAQLLCWQGGQVHPQLVNSMHTTTVAMQQQQQQQRHDGSSKEGLQVQQQEFDAITDQIPLRPVGPVEGASYTLLICAGLGLAGAVLWATVNELLIQPREYTCFNLALERLRGDPRVTVRLGTPISGYGADSRNRAARQRIAHRDYTDPSGVEHIQVQFHARGPSSKARVTADMYQDSSKKWQYSFLFVDVESPVPQRVVIVGPQYSQ